MGGEGLVRRGRSATGARPPLSGKEAVLAPRRVRSSRERAEAERERAGTAGAPGGRWAGRAGGGVGAEGGDEGKAGLRAAPPVPSPRHFLPPPRRRGLGAGLAGQPAPGAAPPGEGRARKSALPRARQGLAKGAGLGKCAMLLLWQELVCNKSLEHFPCERE